MFRTHLRIFLAHVIGLGLISIFFLVALVRVEPQLKKKCFVFIKKNGLKIRGVTTWYQSVRCENLGLWGDFCLDGLHVK